MSEKFYMFLNDVGSLTSRMEELGIWEFQTDPHGKEGWDYTDEFRKYLLDFLGENPRKDFNSEREFFQKALLAKGIVEPDNYDIISAMMARNEIMRREQKNG